MATMSVKEVTCQDLLFQHRSEPLATSLSSMSKTYPIVGIIDTALPVRPELSSWSVSNDQEHQRQVSLFLHALDTLQKKDPLKDPLSYFRLSGIHGSPGQVWDNAKPPANSMKGTDAKGYCYHNSYLFPVWHRPYMVLYEQCLYNTMVNELLPQIKDETQRASWRAAADRWRLPFWDWAIPQEDTKKVGLPNILAQDKFDILELGGSTKISIANPMFKYTHHMHIDGKLTPVPMGDNRMGDFKVTYNVVDKVDKESKLDFGKTMGTSRYANPSTQEWVNGNQRLDLVNSALQNPDWKWMDKDELTSGSFAHNVHRLLSQCYFKSYKPFSSTCCPAGEHHKPNDHLSLEMIHNNIHQFVGGGGKDKNGIPTNGFMSNVPVSSFDPVFWMHHNNIDRIFAIWQFLNPEAWLTSEDECKPTDELQPFHMDEEGTVFTANDVRRWEKFGYTYPELVPGMTKEKLQQLIYDKYGRPSVEELIGSKDGKGITDTHFQDYVINVQYDRYALRGQPYTIYFLLEVDDDHVYYVGQISTFSAQLSGDCGNCESQKKNGVLSKGQVPLTPQLVRLVRKYSTFLKDASGITGVDVGLNPEFMNVFLQKTLYWHVVTNFGNEVPLSEVPNLEVSIHTGKAAFDDTKGPVYGVD